MDKSIFERVLEVSDVFVLIGRAVDGLPPGTQSEIFEFLAVVCLSGNFPTCYFQILESIRRDVGYPFLVASLSSKHGDLPSNTLILVNGLLYGTDQTDIITKILSELEDAHFHNVFDVLNKSNVDETWTKQAEIFKKIEEEHVDSPELKVLKLMAEMKKQEDEIKLLRSKNIQLADDLETELCKQENYLTENETLKQKVTLKDEVINRLEEKIKSTYEIPGSGVASAANKPGKQPNVRIRTEDASEDEDSFFSPMERVRNRGFSNPIKPKKVKHSTVPTVASVNGLPPPSDIPPIPAPLDDPPPPMDDPPAPAHIPPPMDNPPPPSYLPEAANIPPPMDTPPAPEPVNHSKNLPVVPFEMNVIHLVETWVPSAVVSLSEIVDVIPREEIEPAGVKVERLPVDVLAPPVNLLKGISVDDILLGNGPSEMSLLSMSTFDVDMPCLPVIPPLPVLPPNFVETGTNPTMAGLTPRNTVIPPPSAMSADRSKRLSIPGNSGVVITTGSVSSDAPPKRPSVPFNSGVISAPVSSDVPTKRLSIPGNSGTVSLPCPVPSDPSIKRLSIPGNSVVVITTGPGPVSVDLPSKRTSMPNNSAVITPTGPVSSDLPSRRSSMPPGSSCVVSTHSTVPTTNSGVIPAPPGSVISPPPPPPPGGKRLSGPGQNGVLSPPLPTVNSDNQGLPPKKTQKPSKKMRGFMWVKLPAKSIHGSIWKELDDEKHTLNLTEIEDLFGVDEDRKSNPALSKIDQDVLLDLL